MRQSYNTCYKIISLDLSENIKYFLSKLKVKIRLNISYHNIERSVRVWECADTFRGASNCRSKWFVQLCLFGKYANRKVTCDFLYVANCNQCLLYLLPFARLLTEMCMTLILTFRMAQGQNLNMPIERPYETFYLLAMATFALLANLWCHVVKKNKSYIYIYIYIYIYCLQE